MATHPVYRQSWRLRGLMDEYLVLRGVDVGPDEAPRRVPAHAARGRLRGWRGDPFVERTLMEVHEWLGGARVRWGDSHSERQAFLERAWSELEEAFETGRLTLLRVPRPAILTAVPPPVEAEDWDDESEPTSWVGLLLEDEEGNPVPSQRVRIKLADGTVRESLSDEKGRLRLNGIPVGTCQVEFVGIDAADWRAA